MNLPMFVGAFTACVLDNTVGGATRHQRGLRERGAVWEAPPDGRGAAYWGGGGVENPENSIGNPKIPPKFTDSEPKIV